MQNSYRIGALAEKIVAVNINRNGTITPIRRQREANGRMVDVPEQTIGRAQSVAQAEFVARVAPGHFGNVTMAKPIWDYRYSVGVIPLGKGGAFADDELGIHQISASAAAAFGADCVNPDEVWFRFADGKLTWKSGHVSGEAVINETYPELAVVLRLPPGNHGEISFASPLFTTADGEPASVLSVA